MSSVKTRTVSACLLDCPDGCSFVVETNGEGGVRIRGNPEHPFTQGFICAKTAKYPERLAHPARITSPLLRQGGGFEPVPWGRALELVAGRIDALRATPERMAHVKGGALRGVLAQASRHLFAVLGATGTSGSPCDEAGIAASIQDFGALDHNAPQDLLHASRIVNWGRDLTRCSVHQLALVRQARRQGARVLSLSPGGDGCAEFSDRVLRVRPGCDRFLAAAACKALLERGVDPQVREAVAGLEAFEALLAGHDTAALLDACGVGPAEFAELLACYIADGPTATLIGWGVQRYLHGGENVRFIDALAVLSGNVGRRWGGVYFNISSGRNFTAWAGRGAGPRPRLLPLHALGRALLEADPPVELLWVDGMNPVAQLPDGQTLARAMRRCPFTVVVEAFMTDTAAQADLILPCALMTEREDLAASCLHSVVNHAAKVQDPPGEARADFDFVGELGRMLREPVELPDAGECFRTALAGPATPFTMDELRARGFMPARWPEVAFEGMRFAHPDGRCRLPLALHPEPGADPDWPCALLTLVHRDHIHSQRPPDEAPGPPRVMVSPDNPCLPGLDQDRPVYLATAAGRMAVSLGLDPGVHPQAIVGRRGGWLRHGRCFNAVIEPRECDLGGGTAYYSQRARLEN